MDFECAFRKLTAAAPYATPAGFMTMEPAVLRAEETGDPTVLPPGYLDAVRACITAPQ